MGTAGTVRLQCAAGGRARVRGATGGPGGAEWVGTTMKLVTVLGLALTSLAGCAANEGTSASSLTQEPGACGEIETHVIGIRQGYNGAAQVHVSRPGKQALVVSAHDATRWTITVDPGVELEAVYAVGIAKQTVVAPAGVRVVEDSKQEGGPYACGYTWPASGTDCNTESLLKLVEKRVHPVTSFHGCFSGSIWSIEDNMAVIGNCNTDIGPAQTDMVEGC